MDPTVTDRPYERYQTALQLAQSQSQLLWTVFGAFLVVHGIVISFVLDKMFGEAATQSSALGALAAFSGLLLCVPWLTSYERNSRLYRFRMAQARDSEPPTWGLVAGDGLALSRGKCVNAGGRCHHLTGPARLPIRASALAAIIVFASVYLSLGIYALAKP